MRRILMLLMVMTSVLVVSCHQDEDDIFTNANVVLQEQPGITIERVQGTVSLTNLNTKQVVSASNFDGNIAKVNLLRGSYAILIEGSIQYKDAQGTTQVRMFRASTDYVGLEKENFNEVYLDIIWM